MEIKRIINSNESYQKDAIPNFYWDAIRQAYGLGTKKEIPVSKNGMFSPEERQEYIESFKETNAYVAKEYLGREDGNLFVSKALPLPQWKPDDYGMLSDMIRVFAGADTYLFTRQQEPEAQLEEAKKKLQEIYSSLPYRILRKLKGKSRKEEK